MISITQAVEFIRKHEILKDWTDDQIKWAIIKAINEKTLVYTTNKDGGLNGICFGEDHKEEKRLHVKCLVGYKRIKDFIKYYKQKYPGYFISAYRYNKLVNYNF
ncbi:MAG TPA: hypothetical protein VF849_01505 [Blattabacteriaceae bacterium]